MSHVRSALPYCSSMRLRKPRNVVLSGVAGHDFVGDGEALGTDDEGDDDLDAVGPLVPAVPMLPLAAIGRIGLEVGTRQIVEEDVECRVEQVFPPPGQVVEEIPFVFEQSVQALVEFVDLHQFEAGPEEIGQGACLVPLPVIRHSLPGSTRR